MIKARREDGIVRPLLERTLGEDVELEQGIAAARRCGVMLLAQIKSALGSLDRVERVVVVDMDGAVQRSSDDGEPSGCTLRSGR